MAYLPETETHFRNAITAAVRAALPEAIAEGMRRALRKKYLTPPEVCEFTGWKPRKLAYLKAEKRIPFTQRGRTVLYRTDDIEAFLAEGHVPAKDRTSQA